MKLVVPLRELKFCFSYRILFFNRFSCVGPCFTANLNIDYVRPLLTPSWVLVRAHVERHENRKVFVHASVENGEGGIYAKAVVLFIKPKVSVQEHIEEK
jgi:acyl-coenzyme A thioesterase PaaI-like protein